jgi:hypothetical protein
MNKLKASLFRVYKNHSGPFSSTLPVLLACSYLLLYVLYADRGIFVVANVLLGTPMLAYLLFSYAFVT